MDKYGYLYAQVVLNSPMCSIFDFKISTPHLKKDFNLSIQSDIFGRALPYTQAPTIINRDGEFKLAMMNFSLVPHWAETKKVKFATHNARLYGEDRTPIFLKPTWRTPFPNNHCLVIMDSFVESVHQGPYAGNLISFKRKDNEPLIAAGIYDQWYDKASGEVFESFAILTHEPPQFVLEAGHDRCPVFLNDEAILQWPTYKQATPMNQIDFLISNLKVHDLEVAIDRPLKIDKKQTEFKF